MTTAKGKGSPFWSITVTCSCPDAAWACGKDPANDILCPLQAGAAQHNNKANEQTSVVDIIGTANDELAGRQPNVACGEVGTTASIACYGRSQSTVRVGRRLPSLPGLQC